MSYLGNRAVNVLNLHYGIHALAMYSGGVFFAVFLLGAGVPVPAVLGALALIVMMRFAMRPFILAAGRRWGLRPLLMAGTVIGALQYPLLAEVRGVNGALLVLCVVAAIGDTLYWTCYHAAFAAAGDFEHRGHQLGAREALALVASIVAPLAFGWTLARAGPRVAFGAAAALQMSSVIPLFGIPNIPVVDDAPGAFRASRRGMLIFASDGWIAAGYLFMWQIALFVSLGRSFSAFGAAMALAAAVGAVGGLALGRRIDAGHGHRAVWLMAVALCTTILFRAAATHNATLAVIANACGALVESVYMPTTMTAVYNESKRSPCTLRFHIAAEGGWDVGCATGCLSGAALTMAGAPLWSGILLALGAIPPLVGLLRKHYE